MSSPLVNHILTALWLIFRHSTLQFLTLFGLLFLAGFSLTLISRWTGNSFRQFRFPNFGLYVFGVIGVPIHELCHALFAKIFFHEVKSIKLFDPKGKGGSYGTVVHYYNEKNLYHRIGLFFIGMGPVLLAPLILFAMYSFLAPHPAHFAWDLAEPVGAMRIFAHSFFSMQNWASWTFYVFLYLAICLTSQMELSHEDFKIARDGMLPFFLLLIAINTVAYLFNLNWHHRMISFFSTGLTIWGSFFAVALLIALGNLLLSYLILSLLNRVFGHDSINPFEP